MSYQKLKEDIKSGTFSPAYHFFGPEQYLKQYYAKKLTEKIVTPDFEAFNLIVFDGTVSAAEFATAIESPPMMADKKLIILKETGIFSAGAASKELWQKLWNDLPSYVCILAMEEKFDKRSAVYKAFSGVGISVEFAFRTRGDLQAWVSKKLQANGKTMTRQTLEFFLDAAGVEMYAIDASLEKLIAFAGNRSEIKTEDVEALLVRNIMTKEYVLTDALFAAKEKAIFDALADLRQLRIDPIRILTVISANYLSVMHAKILLSEGQSPAAVSGALGLPSAFLAKKTVSIAAKCSLPYLEAAVHLIKEADYKIKLGLEPPDISIARLCADLLLLAHK